MTIEQAIKSIVVNDYPDIKPSKLETLSKFILFVYDKAPYSIGVISYKLSIPKTTLYRYYREYSSYFDKNSIVNLSYNLKKQIETILEQHNKAKSNLDKGSDVKAPLIAINGSNGNVFEIEYNAKKSITAEIQDFLELKRKFKEIEKEYNKQREIIKQLLED